MARKFTKIPQKAFDDMQLNAGMILKTFDPEGTLEVQDQDVAFTTTGGVSVSCVPTYQDNGSDVDNCPEGTKELKVLTGWEVKLSTTALTSSPEVIKMALGAADIASKKITPRMTLKEEDFADLWWVGDRADGGMVAVKISNALSTGGLTLKTTKNGKGQISVEFMGHISLAAQDTVPCEFYSAAPAA